MVARAEAGTPVWYRDHSGTPKRAVILSTAEGGGLWLFTRAGTTLICAAADVYETEAAVENDFATR
jgi:hypothetical protein